VIRNNNRKFFFFFENKRVYSTLESPDIRLSKFLSDDRQGRIIIRIIAIMIIMTRIIPAMIRYRLFLFTFNTESCEFCGELLLLDGLFCAVLEPSSNLSKACRCSGVFKLNVCFP